jgi:hypothetical protein
MAINLKNGTKITWCDKKITDVAEKKQAILDGSDIFVEWMQIHPIKDKSMYLPAQLQVAIECEQPQWTMVRDLSLCQLPVRAYTHEYSKGSHSH